MVNTITKPRTLTREQFVNLILTGGPNAVDGLAANVQINSTNLTGTLRETGGGGVLLLLPRGERYFGMNRVMLFSREFNNLTPHTLQSVTVGVIR